MHCSSAVASARSHTLPLGLTLSCTNVCSWCPWRSFRVWPRRSGETWGARSTTFLSPRAPDRRRRAAVATPGRRPIANIPATDTSNSLCPALRRSSLQLKSGEPPLALTSKLLENVVAGARAPPVAAAAGAAATAGASAVVAASTAAAEAVSGPSAAAQQPGTAAPPRKVTATPAAARDAGNAAASAHAASNSAPATGAASAAADPTTSTSATASSTPADAAGSAAAPPTSAPTTTTTTTATSSSLLDPALLQADRGQLCSAYRALCAALFVDLVSHCLVLPEQDTWVLLHAVGDGGEGEEEWEEEGEGEEAEEAEEAEEQRQSQEQGGEEEETHAAVAASAGGASSANGGDHAGATGQGDGVGAEGLPEGLRQWMAAQRAGGQPPAAEAAPARPTVIYEEVEAVDEDGDDFVFEDLEDLPGEWVCVCVCVGVWLGGWVGGWGGWLEVNGVMGCSMLDGKGSIPRLLRVAPRLRTLLTLLPSRPCFSYDRHRLHVSASPRRRRRRWGLLGALTVAWRGGPRAAV